MRSFRFLCALFVGLFCFPFVCEEDGRRRGDGMYIRYGVGVGECL